MTAKLVRKAKEKDGIQEIESEKRDQDSTPAVYTVISYPADFTLEVLVGQLDAQRIAMPPFQRRYVWSQEQASRLIESFLLGLPVPPIFLFKSATDGKQYLLDGQQRLRSVSDFFKGLFGEGRMVRGKLISVPFKLIGLNEHSPYLDMTFEDLKIAKGGEAVERLKNATLRSFIVQQLDPKDNRSIYHIFQRLNTGGTLLRGQEIRNCVYAGPFNLLLMELNKNFAWREIFGKPKEDDHLRDVELILRFFALWKDRSTYKKPMNDFMNDFMGTHQYASARQQSEFQKEFKRTVKAVRESLGPRPFHIYAGLNSGAFDAVFVAFALHKGAIPTDMVKRYAQLKSNDTHN